MEGINDGSQNEEGTVPKSSTIPNIGIWQKLFNGVSKGASKVSNYTQDFSNVVTQARDTNCAVNKLMEFKKRPKYKLYSLMPLIFIIFLII